MVGTKRKDDRGRNLRQGETQSAKDQRYCYRYTDLTGKRKAVYALSLQELRQKEKDIARDLEDGIDSTKGDLTLNELFKMHMDTKQNVRPTTKFEYEHVWEHNLKNSTLGNMRISQIRQVHVAAFYGDLAKRGLAKGTIHKIHMLITSTLEMAVDADWIRKNPAKNCGKYITGDTKEVRALTRAEQAAFMDFVQNSTIYCVHYPMYSFFLNTGLRISELAGLRKRDIDLKKNVIHVRQQLLYRKFPDGTGFEFRIQDLKSDAGHRDIPLTADAKKALTKQKELDVFRGVQRQTVDGVDDFVFVNSKGMPNSPWAVNQVFDRIVNAYNKQETTQADQESREPFLLPHISAHMLRHTFASRAAESGMDAKTLQNILGHSDIGTTMNIYVQLDADEIQRKMQAIEDAMRVG